VVFEGFSLLQAVPNSARGVHVPRETTLLWRGWGSGAGDADAACSPPRFGV